jgi:murein peptide amidase A
MTSRRSRALGLPLGALLASLLCLVLAPVAAHAAASGPTPPTAPGARTLESAARAWRLAAPATVIVGRSVKGRLIVAHRHGPANAPYVALVLGQMHGTEQRGRAVVAALDTLTPPAGVQVWTISTMNPDGSALGRRTNAHGVDLNRNWPYNWSPAYATRDFYPGKHALTEPETRAVLAFLDHLDPALIVSFHQHFNAVDQGSGKAYPWSKKLAAALQLRLLTVPCNTGPCYGTMTQWFNATHRGSAVTVELPARVTSTAAMRFARGTRSVIASLVPSP